MYITRNIENRRFGQLTAIRFDHHGEGGRRKKYYWLCRCDCGAECFVDRQNLVSGKTRSCGHLRADSVRRHRGGAGKVQLSERDRDWIIRHYKHTKNEVLKERFGITDGWLHRFARENGLRKTGRFMKACQRNAADAARESHLRNGTYPPRGYRIPESEKHCYKAGVARNETRRQKRARISKATDTMRRIRYAERVRIKYGLPRLTRLRLDGQSELRYKQRHYLKACGYILGAPGEWVAYYDEGTRRSSRYENRKPGDAHYIHWEFLPLPPKTGTAD